MAFLVNANPDECLRPMLPYHGQEETFSHWLLGDLIGGLILSECWQITATSVALSRRTQLRQAGEGGALIRTAALGRFPRGQRLDRAGAAAAASTLDVRWNQQVGPRR